MKKLKIRQLSPDAADAGGTSIVYTPTHGNARVVNPRQFSGSQAVQLGNSVAAAVQDAQSHNMAVITNPSTHGIQVPGGGIVFEDPAIQANINKFPIPRANRVTVTSTAGVGANPLTTCFLFNQTSAALDNEVVDNGSGSGSITYNYQDKFNGRQISRALADSRMSVGYPFYGFSIRLDAISGGVSSGDPNALGTTSPGFVTWNGFGRSIPDDFTITTDQTRGDFDTSIEVIPCAVNMSSMTQFQFDMPGDTTVDFVATLTFYTTTQFKK